jgi:hypothetical protein
MLDDLWHSSPVRDLRTDRYNVEGNVIKIRQVMVAGPDNKFVIKNYAKNLSSIRDVSLPAFVVDMFPDSEMIVALNPSLVSHRHVKAMPGWA